MKFVEKELKNTISVTNIVNLHFFEFPKDFYTEPDRHAFYELVFVESGRLYINSDNYSGTLEKGQIILHYPNELHALSCEENSSPTVIIIGFNCIGESLRYFSNIPTTLNGIEIKNLAEIIKEGRNVFAPPFNIPTYDMKKKKNVTFGSEQILKIMLEYFLIRILRKSHNYDDSVNKDAAEKIAIGEIVNYLDQNYTEKITIDELAFIFNTNRSTLCKEFKFSIGKTVSEYVNDKKAERARYLLRSTNRTITSIAEELGFNSIHYFTRFFKQHCRTSPLAYRRQSQSAPK